MSQEKSAKQNRLLLITSLHLLLVLGIQFLWEKNKFTVEVEWRSGYV